MNEEAVKIALRSLYETFIKDSGPEDTRHDDELREFVEKGYLDIDMNADDLDTNADKLYHKICIHFDLGDDFLRREVQACEVLLDGVKTKGITTVIDGADYLMELCHQHFS